MRTIRVLGLSILVAITTGVITAHVVCKKLEENHVPITELDRLEFETPTPSGVQLTEERVDYLDSVIEAKYDRRRQRIRELIKSYETPDEDIYIIHNPR